MQKSVALCTYNGEKYLKEQLESILQQSVAVNEIIVCDDNSTDQTFVILEKYQSQYPDLFKIYRNEENLGYVKNFEKAIMLCSGDLIFLCDQDDIWYNNKVETVEKAFEKNQEATVLCHNINLLGNNQQEKNYWKARGFNVDKNNSEILEMTLLAGNIFPGMTMVISKDAQKRFFPLKKLNRLIIHDFELILQSCKENSLVILNEILGDYRLHDKQNIGFEDRNTDKKITVDEVYTRFKSIDYIQKMVSEFNLDQNLVTKYRIETLQYSEKFLNQFSFFKKIWMKTKLNHYYKIK